MAETLPSVATAPNEPRKLDDVLIAMDVVDTLRHREESLTKELDTEGREERQVARLREIYKAQGIEVSDDALREGVRALEEKRFHYQPPRRGFSVRLAEAYIDRDKWSKPVIAGLAAIGIGAAAWQFGVVQPSRVRAEATRIELTQTLPTELQRLHAAVLASSRDPDARVLADSLLQTGTVAAGNGEARKARDSVIGLKALQTDLAATYQVQVVYGYDSDGDERQSGIVRINDEVAGLSNYYLIVEAVNAGGDVLEVPITNEETRATKRVRKWGQRVSKDAFNAVAEDKRDDLIIQNNVIGRKIAGQLKPVLSVETPGGAITEWEEWR